MDALQAFVEWFLLWMGIRPKQSFCNENGLEMEVSVLLLLLLWIFRGMDGEAFGTMGAEDGVGVGRKEKGNGCSLFV